MKVKNRNRMIVETSGLNIAANFILAAFKLVIGILAGSLAIVLDAVNNISDSMSSLVTIVGTLLASKRPNRKHPFGYGRIEYITSTLIAVVVTITGSVSLHESVGNILHPQIAHYSFAAILVILLGIGGKLCMGTYVGKVGNKVGSKSLQLSGHEAYMDSLLSVGTLIAILVSMYFGVSIDGFVGAIISIFIIKGGVEVMRDSMAPIIGERHDNDESKAIKQMVAAHEGVNGAYDLVLHNYGPEKTIGAIHVEVDDDMSAQQIHRLTHDISQQMMNEYNIIATVGIYAQNTHGEGKEMRAAAQAAVGKHPEILGFHGFYADMEQKQAEFDLVMDFDVDSYAIKKKVIDELLQQWPDFSFHVTIDTDFSD